MAKKSSADNATNSRVKVRVFEFEMEGSDESIQDTMKTLAAALTRGGAAAVPTARRIRSDSSTTQQLEVDQVEIEEPDSAEDEVLEEPLVRAAAKPKRQKKVRTFDILDDIRFDEVEPTLSDVAVNLSPKSDLKKYLVIALWYKDHLKIAEINVRHWYTALKYLKWTMPDDPAQPIRDLVRQDKLSKGKESGLYFINHIGEKDLESLNKAA
jgi:hypothetical protein